MADDDKKLSLAEWWIVAFSALVICLCIGVCAGCTFAPHLHYGAQHYHDKSPADDGLVVEIMEPSNDELMETD